MASHAKYILTGASSAFVIRIVGVIFGFLLQVVCARVMAPSDFGVYVYLLSVMSVLSVFSRFGLDSSLPRFLPVFLMKEQLGAFNGVLILSLAIPLGIAAVIGAGLCLVDELPAVAGRFKYSELFWGVALLVPAVSLLDILRSALLSLKVVRHAELLRSILRPVFIIVFFLIAYITGGQLETQTAVILHVIALSTTVCLGAWVLYRVLPYGAFEGPLAWPCREVVQVSIPLLLMASFGILISELTVVFLGWHYQPEQVAVYGVCVRIAVLAAFALQATNTIMNPLISELYYAGKHDELQKALSFSAAVSMVVTLLLVVFLIFSSKHILGIFGNHYRSGANLLIILVLAQFINAASGPVGSVMKMSGKHNQSCIIMFLTMLWSILFGYYLIKEYGVYGAAITNLSAMIMWNGAMLVYVIKKMNLNPTLFGIDSSNFISEVRQIAK